MQAISHPRMTPWVLRLILANAAVLLLLETVITSEGAFRALAFDPATALSRPWTFVTYMFVHADLLHLLANVLGLVPGFAPPTSTFNITFALGCVSFAAYHAYGVREQGIGTYLKHFLGPVMFIAPLMFVIEIFSHAFRPVSLGVRLYANMFADHTVIEIFTGLTKVGIPVIFYCLGFFVCIVQSFVFTMLSAIYISGAVSHGHGGGHEEAHH